MLSILETPQKIRTPKRMESHVDVMELFEVKIQLNQLKDLQLDRKKLDEKIEKTIHQLEQKINMVSLQADTTLMPSHLRLEDSVMSRDHFDKKKDSFSTQNKTHTGEKDTHLVSKLPASACPTNEGNGYRVYVAGFGANVKRDDLMQTFGKFGLITEIWMAQSTPRFGFVVFKNVEDSEEAIWRLDSSEICGNKIYVAPARPRTKGTGSDTNITCFLCGERGHFSRECPKSKGVMFPTTPSVKP